jgi:hypothetical protein
MRARVAMIRRRSRAADASSEMRAADAVIGQCETTLKRKLDALCTLRKEHRVVLQKLRRLELAVGKTRSRSYDAQNVLGTFDCAGLNFPRLTVIRYPE